MEANPSAKQFTFSDVTAMKKVFALKKRIRAVAGGTSASKTISILTWIIDYCQSPQSRSKICTIASESYPHLEKGAILDFKLMMLDRNYWDENRWNETKHTYQFETGHRVEFSTMDTITKARGPRRDVLFINECNALSWPIVDQLVIRTREIVWLDWNPSEEFWFYSEMLGKRDDVEFITLTYKDNEALDASTVKEIESHRNNPAWWTVYGEGKLGVSVGRIYKDWAIIDTVPHEARLVRRGLDFGYSNDPSALIDIYEFNGGFILDEQLFQKGMQNNQIASFVKTIPEPQMLIIADSAEPKSIDELKTNGLNVLPSNKGPGSVNQGIQFVQGQRISVTSRSLNVIKEYRNYLWLVDRDGKSTNTPSGGFDHSMDAIRYALEGFKPKEPEKPTYQQPAYQPVSEYEG
jgi:phage terminase large subunit